MSRPRRKPAATASEGVQSAPSEVGSPPETEVLCLAESILFGVRRFPGDRFPIPTERVDDLFRGGLVVSRAQIDAVWSAAGRVLSPPLVSSSYAAVPYDPSALKVLQLTAYDPGSSVYRYHSAANVVPGVVSAFARFGHSNPHCDLRQWDGEIDEQTIRVLLATADVVHSHMDYYVLTNNLRESTAPGRTIARTYHGSVDPGNMAGSIQVNKDGIDDRMKAVVFGARPYHHRFGVPHWLPIPMPVQDYLALAKGYKRNKDAKFRIAHSPTMRKIKGTSDFLAAVEYLYAHEGLPVEAVLIENTSHGEALRMKAECDAVFDSFWLGMQGSGLEGAAMKKPVLAGDPEAQRDLTKLGIEVPWTVANDVEGLRAQIRRLVLEPKFAEAEARRVHDYVLAHHDYPVVGAKYATILTEAVRGSSHR